jgi:hypothetical protein
MYRRHAQSDNTRIWAGLTMLHPGFTLPAGPGRLLLTTILLYCHIFADDQALADPEI